MIKRVIITLVVFAGVLAVRAEVSTNAQSSVAEYARWIKPWMERPMTNSIPGGPELKAVVTIVQGEQPLSATTNMTPVERLYLAYRIRVIGSEITTNGYCRSYYTSDTDSKSASLRLISPDNLEQLDKLLDHLPDDDMKLPPPGQRIVVQVLEGDHWLVRVYNGTDMPPQVHSILTLINNPFIQVY